MPEAQGKILPAWSLPIWGNKKKRDLFKVECSFWTDDKDNPRKQVAVQKVCMTSYADMAIKIVRIDVYL